MEFSVFLSPPSLILSPPQGSPPDIMKPKSKPCILLFSLLAVLTSGAQAGFANNVPSLPSELTAAVVARSHHIDNPLSNPAGNNLTSRAIHDPTLDLNVNIGHLLTRQTL